MKFKRNLSLSSGLHPVTFVPLINGIFLLFIFAFLSPYLLFPTAVNVHLPKTVTSDIIPEQVLTIAITGEDVIYFNNQIMTEKELKKLLLHDRKNQAVLIKADGRTSLARVIDVWNICRELGIERINVATTKIK